MTSQCSNPLSNLRAVLDEIQVPELILLAFDQVQKGDNDTPWMWAVDNESLKEYTRDLLPDI